MASSTDHNNSTEGGGTARRKWRRRRKRTRTIGTQTCASIAPNFYDVLDPNAPAECEGFVRLDYYPEDDMDYYPDEDEYEWEEEYEWQSERDASVEFGDGLGASVTLPRFVGRSEDDYVGGDALPQEAVDAKSSSGSCARALLRSRIADLLSPTCCARQS